MKLGLKVKKNVFTIILIAILLFLLYYTSERKLTVNADTLISIEFDGSNIILSADAENEFKSLLNATRIHHSLNNYDGRYFNTSTFFIRIHDADKNGKVRGMLTVCTDDISRSNFFGSKPNGRYKINRLDIQRIADFLSSQITP